MTIAVRDTGIGIAHENQGKIFQGFTQAEASTTRRFGGTGLGLVICQRLVALMGGELVLQSELGKGTCFSFSINLEVPAAGASEDVAGDGARPLEVLIVDDNELARDTLSSMSRANGWTVQTASSGEAALALFARTVQAGGRFDAVFMDLHMPGLDGWEVARRMGSALIELDQAKRSLRDQPALAVPADDNCLPLDDSQLAAFRELLRNEDLEALSFFSKYQAALNQRLGAEITQRIAELLDGLGFGKAAELVPEGLGA